MNIRSQYLLLFSVVILFASCSPKYYTPNTQNVPILTKKGEAKITAAFNGNIFQSSGLDKVDLLSAYAVSNKIGVQLNMGASGSSFRSDFDGNYKGRVFYLESGIGYNAKVNDDIYFECYAIAGWNKLRHRSHPIDSSNQFSHLSAAYRTLALQPAIAYKKKNISIIISSKINGVNYYDISGDMEFEGELQSEYLKEHSSHIMLEPAITFRSGTDKIQFQMQWQRSYNYSHFDFRQQHTLFTVGAILNINNSSSNNTTLPKTDH